jgi:hypothetical protein
MTLLEKADKEWGDSLHEPNKMRPYNVAPFYIEGKSSVWQGRLERDIEQGATYSLRVAFMDDARAAWFCETLPTLELPPLVLFCDLKHPRLLLVRMRYYHVRNLNVFG